MHHGTLSEEPHLAVEEQRGAHRDYAGGSKYLGKGA